jgi:hypothetical protein
MMDSKGIFFTLLGIVLVGLFISTFVFYVHYRQSRQMDSYEIRINSMNELLKSTNADLQRALYISGFRSILSLVENVTSPGGTPLLDSRNEFLRMILNGTTRASSRVEGMMVNQTITNWTNKIESLASQMDFNLSILLVNISVYQDNPWSVGIRGDFNMSLSDTKKIASWKTRTSITTAIDIVGLEDPLYSLGTSSYRHRWIVRANTTVWNTTGLKAHLDKKTYVADSDAPDFLMRLQGLYGPSSHGIGTLVDKYDWPAELGAPDPEASSVDYVYFSHAITMNYSIYNISDLGVKYSGFRLDSGHIDFYGMNGHNYVR